MKDSNSDLMNFDLPPLNLAEEEGVPRSNHTQKDEVKPVTSHHLFDAMPGENGTVWNAAGSNSIKGFDGPPNFGNNAPYAEPENRDMLNKEVFSSHLTLLDLSSRKLTIVPNNVMSLNNLVYLYLANNKLCQLPDHFFNHFPALQWLDLRYNNLTSLPGPDIDKSHSLHCLLLEGNNIMKLPIELGYVHTLHGLNVRDNPLEMPPEHIIEQGVEEILRYLREKYQEQTQASKQSSEAVEETALEIGVEDDGKEQEEEGEEEDVESKSRVHEIGLEEQQQQQQQQQQDLPQQQGPDLPQQQRQDEEQQQQLFHLSDLKEETNANMEQNSELQSENIPKKHKKDMKKFREYESKILARQKNAKIEYILQKRKDEDSLKKFRQETKLKQKLLTVSVNEIPNTTGDAPFGVYGEYMKMMSREEATKEPVLTKPLPKLVPIEIKKLMSKEKSEKILELEQKIRSHYIRMHERRKKPKGTIAEEVEATKEYMNIAINLQLELEEQRQNLEYRFKAFTADS
ncbi:leucine-rich repeat-containing protein 27-like isoform X2 [Octopus sinensis]|uniref:Leucine-rich repeat-containing protein 27-like isoform X2 n=1 Tax=Octopus sinensis TaxID=2607531 RepID=A0A6P7TI26_9MOLL|nr:leucine-rich repeat-containing protein 27-like isoform X2 [Octopus sinensis]